MPEIELKVMDGVLQGRVVEVFHFQKETFRAHGTPFNFVVVDEEFIDTKERLFQRLGMPRKEFERIKICIVPKVGKHVYLADGSLTIDVDDKILDFRPENGEFFLGLDHIDKGRRTGGVGVKIN
jgi:ubiquitin carboxyl-terminal hydrolase 7